MSRLTTNAPLSVSARRHLLAAALALIAFVQPAAAEEPKAQPLWPDGAPGAVGEEEIDRPSLTIYPAPADEATGAAVMICPGGGYQHLAVDHEGKQIADWLNSLGITAGVLRYRLAPRYKHPAPLDDAKRGLRTLRAHAKDLKIDPQRIGIIGFSAGGHLTSTLATHFDAGKSDDKDPIERVSCRPDAVILCYPVIALATEYAHGGSRKNLLGDSPDPELLKSLSNETQVTSETPPTFLFHTTEDKGVVPENSVLFYLALHKAGVPCEMHIFNDGPHGVGLAQKVPTASVWPSVCANWLRTRGFLEKK